MFCFIVINCRPSEEAPATAATTAPTVTAPAITASKPPASSKPAKAIPSPIEAKAEAPELAMVAPEKGVTTSEARPATTDNPAGATMPTGTEVGPSATTHPEDTPMALHDIARGEGPLVCSAPGHGQRSV